MNVPDDTLVTVKFPWLSVVAPFTAFVFPFSYNVTVAYSSGRSVRESMTLPVIFDLAFVEGICEWVIENTKNSSAITKIIFFKLQEFCGAKVFSHSEAIWIFSNNYETGKFFM